MTRPVDRDPDLLDLVLQHVRVMAPSLSEAVAKQIEERVRTEYGGQRVTLAKRKPLTEEQRRAIYNDSLTSMSTEDIKAKHRVSRATIYRLTKGSF